jgi:lipoprotein NlpD
MEILKSAGLAILLAGCATILAGCDRALTWEQPVEQRVGPGRYTVKAGDTLYSISWRNRLDWRDVARWNGLAENALIYPGQLLRLTPPSSGPGTSSGSSSGRSVNSAPPREAETPARAAPAQAETAVSGWYWPATGKVLAGFGDKATLGSGLDIGGRLGEPVRAAASGRVVYAGSGLIGYGKLIIIKHNDTFLSAYGHNRTLAVKEGDAVKIGQKIAEIGEGPGKKPLLHFEIRVNGKPVDPVRYLPRR